MSTTIAKKNRQGKRISKEQLAHIDWALDQPTRTGCAWCPWEFHGTAGDGIAAFETHRADNHPEKVPGRIARAQKQAAAKAAAAERERKAKAMPRSPAPPARIATPPKEATPVSDPVISDDELLEQIRAFHREHGHAPAQSDFLAENGFASPTTFKRRFGGIGKARTLAGFDEPERPPRGPAETAPTLNEVIAAMHRWMDSHGGAPPSSADWMLPRARRGDYPNYDQTTKHGSWRDVVAQARGSYAGALTPLPPVALTDLGAGEYDDADVVEAERLADLVDPPEPAKRELRVEFTPDFHVMRRGAVVPEAVPDVVIALARIEGLCTYGTANIDNAEAKRKRIRALAREALGFSEDDQ